MTDRSRFQALLECYGAAPHRWPADERDAALAWLRREGTAPALMEEAGRLDDRLHAYAVPSPSSALAAAVMAGIPARPLRRLRLWWAAAGAAAVGLGGVAVGTAATAALLPAVVQPADLHEDMTAFGGTPAEDAP